MTPFEAFQTYQAVRLHFTGNFDFFKYNGKTSAKEESFNLRKDKYSYHRALREIDNNNMHFFFAVNFLMRNNNYIKNMFEEEAKENFNHWCARQASRSTILEQDLEFALKNNNYDEVILKSKSQHPLLLTYYLQKDIHLETLYILDHYLGIFDKWFNDLKNDFIWQDQYPKIIKFAPFFWNWAPPADIIYKNIIKKYLVN